MKKKKNKKLKILKGLGILIIIGLFVFWLLNIRVKNIYVTGNIILTDQDIIELAGIQNYPKLFSVSIHKMKNQIKMNQVIDEVNIKKSLFGRIDINVLEYNMLLKDETDNMVYLSNGKKITPDETILGIPSLINVVDQDILEKFLKKLDTIDKDILSKISEIKYTPNDYDKDLFLFYMNDGNCVYITTTRLSNINKYENVLVSLNGQKGILYLDSGNHFEIFQ